MAEKTAARRRRRPVNCWEFKDCGRGPGNEPICPAATESRADGVNCGSNGGRVCWAIAGTLCGGRRQGTYSVKLDSCMRCDFYQLVLREEQVEPCQGYRPRKVKR